MAIVRPGTQSSLARRPFPWADRLSAAISGRLAGQVIAVVLLAVVWELIGRSGLAYNFPSFSETIAALVRLVSGGRLWKELTVTLQAFTVGYVMALAVGIAVGLAFGRFPTAEAAASPFINALMSTPLIAFVPLFVVWFGVQSIWSRVAVVFIYGVFIVLVNTSAGVRETNAVLKEMALSFGANHRQMFRYVIIPAAIPLMFAGIRLGTAHAVKGMIMGEMLITVVGLGGLIMEYGQSFKTDMLFSVILAVLVLALLVNALLESLERWLLRWRPNVSR